MARLRSTDCPTEMSARLRYFDPDDWPDGAANDDDAALPYGYSWSLWLAQSPEFRARWRWNRARQVWRRANGANVLDVLRDELTQLRGGRPALRPGSTEGEGP
jgi:hypothetical protein